jgi:hypothetical protein
MVQIGVSRSTMCYRSWLALHIKILYVALPFSRLIQILNLIQDIGIDGQPEIAYLENAIKDLQSRAHATRTKLWGFGIHVRDSNSVGTLKENLKIIGLVVSLPVVTACRVSEVNYQ